MQYVTTDKEKDDGFHLYVEEYRFEYLRQIICEHLLNARLHSRNYWSYSLYGLPNQFRLQQLDLDKNALNVSCLVHDCFSNKSLIVLFYKSKEGKEILSKPVATLSTLLNSPYGLCLPQQTPIYLPTLALLLRNNTLLEVFLQIEFDPNSDKSSQFVELSFLLAVYAGDKSSVLRLFEYGATVNENSILIASLHSNLSILNTLLERRGSSYKTCYASIKHQNSPLITAAARGSISSVQLLIAHDVDVNYCNSKNITALSTAVIYGQVEICRILLENGASVNVRENKYKRTPLHIVADLDRRRMHSELVDIAQLLIRHGASVFTKDYRGHLPIHCAAIRHHNEIVETLLEEDISQASVKITSHGTKSVIKGMNLYHIAVWKNNPRLIDILLKMNIDPNIPDSYGRTPFYSSVYDGKQNICERLFDVANIKIAEKTGFTPLHAAVRNGNAKLVKLICPYANVNARDNYGKTPVHTACETMDLEIFSILIDYRADVRMRTNKGQTIFDILQSGKARSRKRKSSRNYENPVSMNDLFEQFQQVVARVDNEFAYNWERLPFSWRVQNE